MVDLAVSLATDLYSGAVPVAVVFGISEFIVSTFLRVAFGGRLWIGK